MEEKVAREGLKSKISVLFEEISDKLSSEHTSVWGGVRVQQRNNRRWEASTSVSHVHCAGLTTIKLQLYAFILISIFCLFVADVGARASLSLNYDISPNSLTRDLKVSMTKSLQ